MAHTKKPVCSSIKKKYTKTTIHIVVRNISFRLTKQGYLSIEIPEIEAWREQE
jgi:hypothetical protein